MKRKIKITENQLKKIIKEQKETMYDDLYKSKVSFTVYFNSDAIYGDSKVLDVSNINDVSIYFRIDFERKSYGITNFSIHSIQGPEYLEFEIELYDDSTKYVKIPINWGEVVLEDSYLKAKYIGLDNEGAIDLVIENNEVVVEKITIESQGL